MHKRLLKIVLFAAVTLIFVSCNTTKYVPDGKYLLNKVKIESDTKAVKPADLTNYLRQNSNPKLFDFIPFNVGLYSLSSPDTALWINRFLRQIGDEPVIYDSAMTVLSEIELKKYMESKGYYNAKVTSEVTYKKKKASVKYTIASGDPYTINSYKYVIKDSTILGYVVADSAKTLVHIGDKFDTDVLQNERMRITKLLRNNGYYEFKEEHIMVIADSTVGDHKIDVILSVQPMKRIIGKDKIDISKHKQFRIRNVNYYALSDITDLQDSTITDSLKVEKYKNLTLYSNARVTRPKALYRKTYLEPDTMYNESNIDKTYAKLTSLHTFKQQYITLQRTSDSTKCELDCDVILTPDKTQSFSAQIDGTNNEGDFGIAGKLAYTHGNIFKGGEQLKISLRGANESLITKRAIWDVSAEAALNFPILLCPFLKRDFVRNNNTSTETYINFSWQTRQEYTRIIAGAGIRYRWMNTRKINHQFDLIDLNYVYLPYKSADFQKTIDQSLLKYSYEDHFIMKIGYSIAYSTQQQGVYRNNYSIRAAVETAGNILYGICAAADAKKNENGSYLIGGIPFAQYAKVDFDYCFRHVIDKKNTVAYHIGFGIGVPYANSNTLPFEKRYYGGGANSVRGWNARSLGPGNYAAETDIDYMKQSGDINLNLNIEYRTLLFWKLEFAAFLDAGNIWTLNDEKTAEGQFRFDRFYKQIALGYGIGLRLNFDFFVVRLDWGLKAFDPSKEAGKQWRFVPGWDITKDTALHFAVGYPF